MSTKQMKCSPPLKGRAHLWGPSDSQPHQALWSHSALTPAALNSACLEDLLDLPM